VNLLTVYGTSVVTLMMVFYALEQKSSWFILAFGISYIGSAMYGFLAGTWPFGIVESICSVVAFRKWYSVQNHFEK